MIYTKIINRNVVEYPPQNKGNIINYNLDTEMMKQDGYKTIIFSDRPDDSKEYIEVYELSNDEVLQTWELLPVDLETLRRKKLREFFEFDAVYRRTTTVEYDGKKFSISNDAKVNLMAVVQQAQIFGTSITYFEKNGNHAEYTLEEFLPIAAVISQGIAGAETSYYEKESEILNAQTVEELEAIVWER